MSSTHRKNEYNMDKQARNIKICKTLCLICLLINIIIISN